MLTPTLLHILVLVGLLITILLIAGWNGLVINWRNATNSKDIRHYSDWWHAIGLVIRTTLVIVAFLVSNWIFGLIAAFIAFILYNIIINLIIGEKWYYVGTTSTIDKLIRKLFLLIKKYLPLR